MKKILLFLLCIAFTSFAQETTTTQRLIVKVKQGVLFSTSTARAVRPSRVDQVTQKYQAVSVKKQKLGKKSNRVIYLIEFPAGTNLQQVIEEYQQTGDVEYAEPDYKGGHAGAKGTSAAPSDSYYSRQWSLKNNGTFPFPISMVVGADIDMERAWNIEQGSSNVVVGVIDSGAKLDHPEFSGRIWSNTAEIAGNSIDDDGNGYIDDTRGWDFVNSDNNPTDDEGHGSNVAGIIGANANNGIGYAGVDWNCKLMILKGIDNTGSGFYSWWVSAMYYAVDNGANVINMSLGGVSSSTALQEAVTYALDNNVTVVICMMNTNSNVTYYPAGCTGALSVGSTDADDTRSNPFFWSNTSGSNYGNHISVVAPGNYIYGLNHQSNTNYDYYWGGTSQATPHVAGLCALLLAQDPTRTPAQLKSIIQTTAEDGVGLMSEDVPGWDQYYGHGRINAFQALSLVTDVKHSAGEEAFILYPNPSTEEFSVTYPEQTSHIQIFNALGKSIYAKSIQGEKVEHFKLSDNGMYFVKLQVGTQTITQKLLVCK